MKRFYTKTWLAGVACSLLLLSTVACNSGGGGGGGTPPVGIGYGIGGMIPVGGITSPQQIFNGPVLSSSYYGDAQMNMVLYTQSGVQQTGYYSAVAFAGTLNLMQGNLSFCGAPAGTYNLSTVQTGIMSGGSLGPMQLQATGPVTITMSSAYGILENMGARVSFNMNVYINGQPCGQLITL